MGMENLCTNTTGMLQEIRMTASNNSLAASSHTASEQQQMTYNTSKQHQWSHKEATAPLVFPEEETNLLEDWKRTLYN